MSDITENSNDISELLSPFDQLREIMKQSLLLIFLSIQTIMCYSQIENATITYAPLELETPYSIPAQRFEHDLKCDTIEFSSDQEIEGLSKALCSLKDTIHQEKVPDKIIIRPNGKIIRFIMYPRMNTRGKISVNFKNGDSKTYYYDIWTIWDATEDKLYSMTEPFMSFVRRVSKE